ncbi:MAG: acetolactate synthase 3 large subunit [Pseudomonadales bacterium]|uniref:acetolactate synthase 3 large subunit n=1 Tax=unclassified Ketobacter TaxID=2639109 RepID=UPI000C8BF16A|nr:MULTISPECIES: acetolactate synthase 3 large subunit [unclassified Ketobacter]MAQ27065.1 acetolactate synthase 3 large subunit [Pseudomonadales bacterium]MEC8810457.1 acetolactate synthase 3 large subunit [Pseudomonadota bacterium]HAG95533.1 acetolactate synthase 3 large subunit [Gammaproteobacteria bacterium]RLT88189.1 MAG: acetolactate synthase 3 large subunit [Ketobacter sp. GenoA1]RLT94130.1 MAG: acetolactate synthase 3 large subunit [Ketobacter sp.]
MELLSGAEMLVRALKDEGVETIFGYPGGAVLHIYDALFQQKSITHVLVRHEQAAAHMADAFSRCSGTTGVVLATSGPGATNTVTGIATAYMDSIPMVIITGQVQSDWIGDDAFQETDIVGVTRPIVKHSFMVKKTEDIPATIKKAFYIASTGRPGPVLVDIPKDLTNPAVTYEYSYPSKVKLRSYNVVSKGHSGQIKKAVDLLMAAKRPIFYTGGGVVQGNSAAELTELVRKMGFPCTNTLMGLGGFPGDDPLFVGMLGMHGTYEANMAMHHADVVMAIGARFDDRVTNHTGKFCPNAKIIHVDVDPASIAKNIPVDIPIVGPVDQVLKEMLDQLEKTEDKPDLQALEAWWKQIDAWRAYHGLRYETKPDVLKPQTVIEELYRVTNGEAIITSDVGQHQMFAAQYYKYKYPRQWINSGGLGTMGFGLPAAMGCLVAKPDKTVACVTGEGSIQMNIQELSTCLQYHFPVKIVNLNNQSLGMVRQWQDMQYQGRHSSSTYEESLPDFIKLAESYGHVGIRVTKPDQLQGAMEEAFSLKDRLVFLDISVDPTEHVYPMQIKEGSMRDMWLSKTERT